MFRKDLVEDEQKLRLSDLVFGEATGQKRPVKKMIASTVLNRVNDKKNRYGKDIDSVMNKKGAYYALSDEDSLSRNPFKQAATMNFRNDKDAAEFAQIQDLVDNLFSGEETTDKGTHYFKPSEAKSLKKKMRFVKDQNPYQVYSE